MNTNIVPREAAPNLLADTSKLVELLATAVLNFDLNRTTWYDMLSAARAELEDSVRVAARSTDIHYSLASPHFQQRVLELTIRLQLLEELVSRLPLIDQQALQVKHNLAQSRFN